LEDRQTRHEKKLDNKTYLFDDDSKYVESCEAGEAGKRMKENKMHLSPLTVSAAVFMVYIFMGLLHKLGKSSYKNYSYIINKKTTHVNSFYERDRLTESIGQ